MLLSSALPTKMVQAQTPLCDSHSIALRKRVAAVGHLHVNLMVSGRCLEELRKKSRIMVLNIAINDHLKSLWTF